MVFLRLKEPPIFQPEADMCVSTYIKNVLDSQFPEKRFSLKTINKYLKYKNGMGISLDIPFDALFNLNELLNKEKICVKQKENNNINFLYELLDKKRYPIIMFHLRDYQKWKKDKTEVFSDGDETTYHFLIVVGVDKEKELVSVFDPIENKYSTFKATNCYTNINLTVYSFLSKKPI